MESLGLYASLGNEIRLLAANLPVLVDHRLAGIVFLRDVRLD